MPLRYQQGRSEVNLKQVQFDARHRLSDKLKKEQEEERETEAEEGHILNL